MMKNYKKIREISYKWIQNTKNHWMDILYKKDFLNTLTQTRHN